MQKTKDVKQNISDLLWFNGQYCADDSFAMVLVVWCSNNWSL